MYCVLAETFLFSARKEPKWYRLLLYIYTYYLQIMTYLSDLAVNSSLVDLMTIGATYGGLDIVTAKISSSVGISNKPVIYLECGMHSREWLAHATCIWIIDEVSYVHYTVALTFSPVYAIDLRYTIRSKKEALTDADFHFVYFLHLHKQIQLTSMYDQSTEIAGLVDRFDWYITPISNPDGYIYTWSTVSVQPIKNTKYVLEYVCLSMNNVWLSFSSHSQAC